MNDWAHVANIAGPPNVLSIGVVETVPAAADAYATITGTSPAQVLNLGIPEGEIGPPNVLTVGTVETVLPTEPARVTITGTSPAQVINFEIPQGPPGPGAEGTNLGSGTPVFAGADPGTGVMEFWQLTGTGIVTVSLDATGIKINAPVPSWTAITGKPATFPPTLPIAQSGVTNLVSDLNAKAPLASPSLTGNPISVTPPAADNSASIATTSFVKQQGYTTMGEVMPAVATLYAPLSSPTLTGDPKAPTPATADNDTSIATTAFVKAAIAAAGSVATVSDSPPASPVEGQIWWNNSTKTLSIRVGTAWEQVLATWA